MTGKYTCRKLGKGEPGDLNFFHELQSQNKLNFAVRKISEPVPQRLETIKFNSHSYWVRAGSVETGSVGVFSSWSLEDAD